MPRNMRHRRRSSTDDDVLSKIATPPDVGGSGNSDILSCAFVMVNDIGKLDSKGMEGFTRAFKEQIQPPTEIVNEFKNGAMNLAGSATTYIFFTIFAIAAAIILGLAYVGVLSWIAAVVITFVVGLLVLLIASLLYNRVSDYMTRANKEIDEHIADYTGRVFGDVTNAIKAGLCAYAAERTPVVEEDPLDSMLFD